MLEILSIQLVMLPVYITLLCKSTKRHLQSQVWFIYTGLMPLACFWYSKRGVKAKSVWTLLLTRDPETREGNLFIPQNLPSQGRNDPSAIRCSYFFCYFSTLYQVTFWLLYSEEVLRVGESEDNRPLKPLICNCYAHELPSCHPAAPCSPATSSCTSAQPSAQVAGARPLATAAKDS